MELTTSAPEAAPSPEMVLPAHLVQLHGSQWLSWRWVGLRGAGFPASEILRMADSEVSRAADRVIGDPDPKFRELYSAAAARVDAEAIAVLRDDRFRQALVWQNRRIIPGLDHALLESEHRRNKEHRYRTGKVASYWQRYTMKNEAIGFFGPVGWARWIDRGKALRVTPGARLVAHSSVFFEGWAIDALAEAIEADRELRPWLAPARLANLYLDGTVLHRPLAPPLALTAVEAAVFEACDGKLTAREVAARMRAMPALGLWTEAEVYRVIERLVGRGLVRWSLEVPLHLKPEVELRRRLARVGDPVLRERSERALDRLERERERVVAGLGEARRLNAALEVLDQEFTSLTGREPTRLPGQVYAGRTLVFLDCRRDVEVDLGPDFRAALGPPLSLVLASARWLTFEVARLYREAFDEAFQRARSAGGPTPIDLAQYGFLGVLDRAAPPLLVALERLAEKWAQILAVPSQTSRVAWESSRLAPLVEQAFDAPGPGWRLARYHSPDLMVAASSAEAVAAGDFLLVLGELHVAYNTLLTAFHVEQHAEPSALLAGYLADLPETCVVLMVPKHWRRMTGRLYPTLQFEKDLYVAAVAEQGWQPGPRSVPISEFVVEEGEHGPVARTRDGRLEVDMVELFSLFLSEALVQTFRILPAAPHLPRVTIDRLVVCRESWTRPAAELSFARVRDEAARFAAARAWARSTGLPRFAFVRTRHEPKPVFVDFESPIYVDLLAKQVRGAREADAAASVTFTEMLPDPSQTWLTDAEGHRYTSELRVVALDASRPVRPAVVERFGARDGASPGR